MRNLTQPEIDAAPGWATDYTTEDEYVTFISEKHYQNYHVGLDQLLIKCKRRLDGIFGNAQAQPIPRKEFDIWSVKFNGDISLDCCDELSVTFIELEHTLCLGRTEIIAAAKHLKLTPKDLS